MKMKLQRFLMAGVLSGATILALTPSAHCQKQQDIFPVIQFDDVPISEAIRQLTRASEITNYIIAPNASKRIESTVSARWEKITARAAFDRLIKEQGFFIVENPQTGVSQISYTNLPPRKFDEDFIGSRTNEVIPSVNLANLPLDKTLTTLCKGTKTKIEIDPKLSGSPMVPQVTISWKNLTVRQAIAAICENHNLQIKKDESSGVWRISP